jgi:hypothetical protein
MDMLSELNVAMEQQVVEMRPPEVEQGEDDEGGDEDEAEGYSE